MTTRLARPSNCEKSPLSHLIGRDALQEKLRALPSASSAGIYAKKVLLLRRSGRKSLQGSILAHRHNLVGEKNWQAAKARVHISCTGPGRGTGWSRKHQQPQQASRPGRIVWQYKDPLHNDDLCGVEHIVELVGKSVVGMTVLTLLDFVSGRIVQPTAPSRRPRSAGAAAKWSTCFAAENSELMVDPWRVRIFFAGMTLPSQLSPSRTS